MATSYTPVDISKPRADGWVPSRIRSGDSLASLEKESGVRAEKIASVNGVPWFGSKTCAWGRAVSAWVLATGGRRQPFIPESPNTCEPGLGFPTFVDGQVILLPAGLRAPSTSPPIVPPVKANAKWSPWKVGALVVGVLAGGSALLASEKTQRKRARIRADVERNRKGG
jgi:hypothetical protein